jgi:serine phosphatase RsbU (regulator of sigma subunit)
LRIQEGSIRLVELDGTDGLPLGIQAKAGLTELKVVLKPGQTLLMYTDGVPDERSTEVVPFGLERLKEIAVEDGDPESLLEQINRELVLHQGATPPEDDQTLLAIRVDA